MSLLRPQHEKVMFESYSSSWRLFAIRAAHLLMTALLLSAGPIFAQQLSVRHYNVEDGLPHSTVGAIYQDKKGYIWFGTADGLSRFDGLPFLNIAYTPCAVIFWSQIGHLEIGPISLDRARDPRRAEFRHEL